MSVQDKHATKRKWALKIVAKLIMTFYCELHQQNLLIFILYANTEIYHVWK